jgi:hypothetical protein
MDTSLIFLINSLANNTNINIYNVLLILITLSFISYYGHVILHFCETHIATYVCKKYSFTIDGYVVNSDTGYSSTIPKKCLL